MEKWVNEQKEKHKEGHTIVSDKCSYKEIWRWDRLLIMKQYKVHYTKKGCETMIHEFEEMEQGYFNNNVENWSEPSPIFSFEIIESLGI